MPEALLAPRWNGRAPWVETWYLIVRPPDAAWALWARYQILARRGHPPRTSVWGVAFSDGHAVARVDEDARPHELHGAPFVVQTGAGRLDRGAADARLPGLAWDLAWTDAEPPWTVLPWAWMQAAPFPRMKIATPIPRAAASGTVTIGGRRLDAAGAEVMLGHTWGTAHAHRWAWLHAALPGVTFEAVTAVPFRGAPALTAARLRLGARDVPLARLRTVLRAESAVAPVRWRLVAEGDGVRVTADARAPDGDVVSLEYRDPSGSARYCHGCERASVDLTVEEGGKTQRLSGRASLEVATPGPDRFPSRPYA